MKGLFDVCHNFAWDEPTVEKDEHYLKTLIKHPFYKNLCV